LRFLASSYVAIATLSMAMFGRRCQHNLQTATTKKVLLSYYYIRNTKMSILISNLSIKQNQILTKLTGTIS